MYHSASPRKAIITSDIIASRIWLARAVVRMPNQHSKVMKPTAAADSNANGTWGSRRWMVSAAYKLFCSGWNRYSRNMAQPTTNPICELNPRLV